MKSINDISINLKNYQEKVEIEADAKLKKYRNKGKKMLEDTLKRLEVIKEDGAKFRVDLGPDTTAQEKYSMKIHEIVNSTIESIVEPEKIIKKSLNLFAEGTRDALHKQDEMLIKYVSLLKEPSYKKKVKSLSNSLKRLNKDLTKLEKFIIQEYTANANIEDITDKFDDILEVVDKFTNSYSALEEKENEIIEKDKEIARLIDDLDKLNNNEVKIQYEQITDQYQKLQRELDNKFSNIRKALRKFVNLNSKSKKSIDTSLHKEFITDVASTMAKQSSIMGIKSMLNSLDEEMKKGALKLKKDKRESARNDISNFIEEDLQKNWELVKEITDKKAEIKDQLDKLELEKNIEKLVSTISAAKRDRNRIIEREIRDLDNRRSDFDKLFNELSEQNYIKIEVKLELPALPDWANII